MVYGYREICMTAPMEIPTKLKAVLGFRAFEFHKNPQFYRAGDHISAKVMVLVLKKMQCQASWTAHIHDSQRVSQKSNTNKTLTKYVHHFTYVEHLLQELQLL
jgi:hypothetical protein